MIHYQLNQGPGTFTSQSRLTVTIFNANQDEIITLINTVLESPQVTWTTFYSKMLFMLSIQVDVVDSDSLWSEHQGYENWQTWD